LTPENIHIIIFIGFEEMNINTDLLLPENKYVRFSANKDVLKMENKDV